MAKIRIFAKRPTPLTDQNIVTINNFTSEFDVDIFKQVDDGTPELLKRLTLTPASTPPPPPPTGNKDRFGMPFLHPTKPSGFFYEMSDDPRNDQAMDHVDTEFTVAGGVITMKPNGPTSFGVGRNIRKFKDSFGGCKMDMKAVARRGFAAFEDDVRDLEYKVLMSVKGIGDHGISISVCTGHHDSNASFDFKGEKVCCQGCAYMFNIDSQTKPMKMRFEKEQWHVNYVTSPEGWFTHKGVSAKLDGAGFVGIGICRYNKTVDDNPEHDHVILEAYVNPNPETNPDNWIMVKKIEDFTGHGWGDKGDYCPNAAKDQALTWSNAQNRLKTNSKQGSIDFKAISFREITA